MATFGFQTVDRVMLDFDGVPETNEALIRHLEVSSLEEVLDALDVDLRRIEPEDRGPAPPKHEGGLEEDIWGVIRRPVPTTHGIYMEPVNAPWASLQSVEEVEAYPWPAADRYDFPQLRQLCEKAKDRVVVFGRPGLMDLINGTAFGRGVEQVLMDIATRDTVGLALFRKRFEFMFDYARRGLEAGGGKIDILFIGEDLGTQQGLLIAPNVWRDLFRSYLQRMIDLGHQHGAKVMLHSCGSIHDLIPEFIGMGLDALQAVQPKAAKMAPEMLAAKFGGRIVFDGTMDIQETLPFATPEEVRSEVRQRLDAFEGCSGLILGPCHRIQADTSMANVMAMYDEAKKTG